MTRQLPKGRGVLCVLRASTGMGTGLAQVKGRSTTLKPYIKLEDNMLCPRCDGIIDDPTKTICNTCVDAEKSASIWAIIFCTFIFGMMVGYIWCYNAGG